MLFVVYMCWRNFPGKPRVAAFVRFGFVSAQRELARCAWQLACGKGASIGELKVVGESGGFVARISGTEDIHELYAESFKSEAHLGAIIAEAQQILRDSLTGRGGARHCAAPGQGIEPVELTAKPIWARTVSAHICAGRTLRSQSRPSR